MRWFSPAEMSWMVFKGEMMASWTSWLFSSSLGVRWKSRLQKPGLHGNHGLAGSRPLHGDLNLGFLWLSLSLGSACAGAALAVLSLTLTLAASLGRRRALSG